MSSHDRWGSGTDSNGFALSPEAQLAAFRALHVVTKRVHASLDLTETLDAVAQGVVDGAGFGVVAVNLARPDGQFVVVSVVGAPEARQALLGTLGSAAKWAYELERSEPIGALRFVDGRKNPRTEDLFTWMPATTASDDENTWHPLDALYAPLTAPSGEWVGVLSVDMPSQGLRPRAWLLENLELFADHAAIAIQHARLHSALREQEAQARHAATHDALTGLSNRAVLLGAEDLAGTVGQELAVLLIDLDGFKKINDTRGHDAGDEVLREVAQRLREAVRDADIIARVGGDEFVVVMVGHQISDSARSLVTRLQREIARPITGRLGRFGVGASIGLAIAQTPVRLADVLSQADAAMYAQKRRRLGAGV